MASKEFNASHWFARDWYAMGFGVYQYEIDFQHRYEIITEYYATHTPVETARATLYKMTMLTDHGYVLERVPLGKSLPIQELLYIAHNDLNSKKS